MERARRRQTGIREASRSRTWALIGSATYTPAARHTTCTYTNQIYYVHEWLRPALAEAASTC